MPNESTIWVYIQTEGNLYTTGFYDPKGNWNSDRDCDGREEASKRVNYLNGGFVEHAVAAELKKIKESIKKIERKIK